MKRPTKKMVHVIVCIAAVCALMGGVNYQPVLEENKDTLPKEVKTDTAHKKSSDGSFSEEGITQIDTIRQMPQFQVNDAALTVEEVYVSSGSMVKKGDALLKLTDESVQSLNDYYEDAIHNAQQALKQAEANLMSGKLSAENSKQDTNLTAQTAKESYQAALDALDAAAQEKKHACEETEEQIQNYQNQIDENLFYVEVGIDEKQAALDEAQAALAQAQETLTQAKNTDSAVSETMSFDLSNIQVQIQTGADTDVLLAAVRQAMNDYTVREQQAQILTDAQQAADAAQSALEQAQRNFDDAVSDYHKSVEETKEKITQLTENLEKLQAEYEQEVRDAETKKVELKNEYDTAVLEEKYADSTYQSSISKLERAVEAAQETLDEFKEEQAKFLALENGVITAQQDGIIASISYQAQDTLKADTPLVLYSDTKTIFISVEVGQEQIGQVTVGDEVSVMVSKHRRGGVTGIVSSIASFATTGGSASTVTYTVCISVDNSDESLSSGSSATVVFQGKQEGKSE